MATALRDRKTGKFKQGQFYPHQFTFRLKHRYYERFKEICEATDEVPTDLIRQALEEWVDRNYRLVVRDAPELE